MSPITVVNAVSFNPSSDVQAAAALASGTGVAYDATAGSLIHGYYLTEAAVGPRIALAPFSGNHTPTSGQTYSGLDVNLVQSAGTADVVYEDCRIRDGFTTDPGSPDTRPDRLIFRFCRFEPTDSTTSQNGTGGNVSYTIEDSIYTGFMAGPMADRDVTIQRTILKDLRGNDIGAGVHRGIIGTSNGGITRQIVRKCWMASTPKATGGWSGIHLLYNGSPENPGPSSDILSEDNYYHGGEGGAILMGARSTAVMSDMVIRRAVFGRTLYPDGTSPNNCCFQGVGPYSQTGSEVPHPGSIWDSCRFDTPTGANCPSPYNMETEIPAT